MCHFHPDRDRIQTCTTCSPLHTRRKSATSQLLSLIFARKNQHMNSLLLHTRQKSATSQVFARKKVGHQKWQIGPRTVGPRGPVVRGPTVRGKLGPGQLGPGAQLSAPKKWQIGPRTVGPRGGWVGGDMIFILSACTLCSSNRLHA